MKRIKQFLYRLKVEYHKKVEVVAEPILVLAMMAMFTFLIWGAMQIK